MVNRGKIVYLTATAPFGTGEEFLLSEMLMLKKLGADLLIIPRSQARGAWQGKADVLFEDVLSTPLLDRTIVRSFLRELRKDPQVRVVTKTILANSGRPVTAAKNLSVLPKAVYLAKATEHYHISHIHAHWGATTATMAYLMSELLHVPWSVTLHRGDIKADNALKLKVECASFVRCISRLGRETVLGSIGRQYENKVKVIHMGVDCDATSLEGAREERVFTMVTPANLLPVKGHQYLVDACAVLVSRGLNRFQCHFYGEGMLRRDLAARVERKKLRGFIAMPGQIAHDRLLEMYRKGECDAVVLPSIHTDDGTHEGIPVSLMEAMSYGIPVISTNTGGIPELIGGGAGLMIGEKDPVALANAMQRLMENRAWSRLLGQRGQREVAEQFNVRTNAAEILRLIQESQV